MLEIILVNSLRRLVTMEFRNLFLAGFEAFVQIEMFFGQ